MISDLQLLTFEVGPQCNLAEVHPWCPVNQMNRSVGKLISDLDIIAFAGACQARGFQGLVTWHYYNEPMLYMDRVLRIAHQLQDLGMKCGLWTNGSLIVETDLEWVNYFDRIWITLHDPSRYEIYRTVMIKAPGRVTIVPRAHDDRLQIQSHAQISLFPCWRPLTLELIVDFGGTLHICCADWKAECEIGNITQDFHDQLLDKWELLAGQAACGQLPVCYGCQLLEKSPALTDKEFRL